MASSIDEQFVEYIVKSLVNNPDEVVINRTIDEKGVLLELTVNPEDLGRVIGKRGATAQSIRTLLRALGTKNEARYNLKIVDNGVPREDRAPVATAPSSEEAPQEEVASVEESPQQVETEQEPTAAVEDEAVVEEGTEDSDDDESVASKTRKELEDLDDLDI